MMAFLSHHNADMAMKKWYDEDKKLTTSCSLQGGIQSFCPESSRSGSKEG